MNRAPSDAEIKRQVERILGKKISKQVWRYVVATRKVNDVQKKFDTVDWLAREVQMLIAIEEEGAIAAAPQFVIPNRKQRRGKMTAGRREAISEALAAIARQSHEVISFRREVLNDTLLEISAVDRWLKDHQSEGAYPHAILVRLKEGFDLGLDDDTGRWKLEPPLSSMGPETIEGPVAVDLLEYAMPDNRWVRRIPIGRDGTLRKIYAIASDLSRKFSWQQAQATVFLLTDLTPLVETESIEIRYPPVVTLPYGGQSPLTCLLRVVIAVDPMMTPRQLAEKYAEIRTKLRTSKRRLQTEKHLRLALFAITHHSLSGDEMREWNKNFPNWKYSRVALFSRDAKTARTRLLHEPLADLRALPFGRAFYPVGRRSTKPV